MSAEVTVDDPVGVAGEVIMVVDDDSLVRSVAVEHLEDLGYTVLEADSARAALETLRGGQAISLILTDVVMPDMTGRQLADAVHDVDPGVKILYCTGYGENAVVNNLLGQNTVSLSKPYTRAQIASLVRQTLNRPE